MLLICYTKMSNQDDNIIKYASEILNEIPLDVNMLLIRAESFKNIKDFQKAENDLKDILKIENLSENDQMNVQDLLKNVTELRENHDKHKFSTQKKEIPKQNTTKKSEELNDRGNVQFKSNQYANAIQYYSDAIQLCPNVAKYYTNRSCCFLQIRNFDKATLDALKAIEIDSSSYKGYKHAINSFINLGNIDQAQINITKMKDNVTPEEYEKFDGLLKVKNLTILHEEILKFWDGENFEECLKQLEEALKIATACQQYEL